MDEEYRGRPALPLTGSNNGVHIKDANGRQIFSSSRPDEEAMRDVAFVVATVNGHDMLCNRAWKAESSVNELASAFSRLQSEHSDLIERERVLESKLAAVPRYVFWCLNERERGRDVFPSLGEWLGEFAEPEKYPPFNAEDGLIDSITQRGYAVWIRRMGRVPFGVILRRAGRYGAKTVAVYGAGETLPIALERALSKAERPQAQP